MVCAREADTAAFPAGLHWDALLCLCQWYVPRYKLRHAESDHEDVLRAVVWGPSTSPLPSTELLPSAERCRIPMYARRSTRGRLLAVLAANRATPEPVGLHLRGGLVRA